MTVKVGINGYNRLGKRIADAVNIQDDMDVIGVAMDTVDFNAELLLLRDYPLFVDRENESDFEDMGFVVDGQAADMLDAADIVVDCTKSNDKGDFLRDIRSERKKAVFSSDSIMISAQAFNALANYQNLFEKDMARIPAPDVTAVTRSILPIKDRFGIQDIFVTMIGKNPDVADPSLTPELTGHNPVEPDLRELMPGLNIKAQGVGLFNSRLTLHSVGLTLEQPLSTGEVMDVFERSFRIRLVSGEMGIRSLAQVEEMASDLNRARSDLYENVIWADGISTDNKKLFFYQALDHANVIPEYVDCIRAMTGITEDKIDSIQKTDEKLRMNL